MASFKGDIDIDVEVDVNIDCYFGSQTFETVSMNWKSFLCVSL